MKKCKKISLILLALTIAVAAVACGDKKDPEEPQPIPGGEDGPIAGGWTVNAEFGEATIPEEAKAALEKALEGLDGAAYEPVAFLGTQVVAGLNYSLLCKITPVVPNATPKLSIVTVYKDLEGGAQITNTADIDITNYTEEKEIKFPEAGLAGGWSCAEASGSALDEKEQAAFDKAMEGFGGVGFQPLACLGHQVVAGTNHAILCKATRVTAEPASALAVVVVYEDLEGGASVRTICGFEY